MTRSMEVTVLLITIPGLAWACTCPWDYPTCKYDYNPWTGNHGYWCENSAGHAAFTGCGSDTGSPCDPHQHSPHSHSPQPEPHSHSPQPHSHYPHTHYPHSHGPSAGSGPNAAIIFIVVLYSVLALITFGMMGIACRHACELSRLMGGMPQEVSTTTAYFETPLPLMAKGCCNSLRWKTYKGVTVEYPKIASELSSSDYRLCKLLWEYRFYSPKCCTIVYGLLTILYICLAIAFGSMGSSHTSYGYGPVYSGPTPHVFIYICIRYRRSYHMWWQHVSVPLCA